MKTRFLVLIPLILLLASCAGTATPLPQPTVAGATAQPAVPTNTSVPAASPTPNLLGLNIIAQYDPSSQILTIYGVTPAATIVVAGTPLVPPTPAPTNTPAPTLPPPPPPPTQKPVVVAPRPTAVPPAPVTAAAMRGKIMFKTTRDGGAVGSAFAYYVMNPDGSGLQRLDFNAANSLYVSQKSREGFSPDGSKVVLGERHCYGFGTCDLYILDTVADAALINSGDDISRGTWYDHKGYQAKDPAWSPAGNFIAFISNDSGADCGKSNNVFKQAPRPAAEITRLTNYCSKGDAGSTSFSGDGARLTYWSENSGRRQIYVLDVSADEVSGYQPSNDHIISDGKADDWDPLWVK